MRRIQALGFFKGFYRLLGLTAEKICVTKIVMQVGSVRCEHDGRLELADGFVIALLRREARAKCRIGLDQKRIPSDGLAVGIDRRLKSGLALVVAAQSVHAFGRHPVMDALDGLDRWRPLCLLLNGAGAASHGKGTDDRNSNPVEPGHDESSYRVIDLPWSAEECGRSE